MVMVTLSDNILQYVAMATASLSTINSGLLYGWASPTLPQLLQTSSYISVSSDQASWLAIIPTFGSILGSILGALIVDKIGRKNLILVSAFPFFISWLMIAWAKSVTVLLVARFIGGISDGFAACAIPMYLGEIATPRIRGFLGSSTSVMFIFGIWLFNIYGSIFAINKCAIISSCSSLLLFCTFIFMPESPYYYLMKGKLDLAEKSLQAFTGKQEVRDDLMRVNKAVQEQNENESRYRDLFAVKSNRKGLLIMLGLRVFQQYSGINVIMFYVHLIFNDVDNGFSATWSSIIYFSVQLSVSTLSCLLVDKTGRRFLLLLSLAISGVALFSEGVYFYFKSITGYDVSSFAYLPLISLIVYVAAFSIGLQTIPVLMLGELFPTNVKAFAICVIDISFSVLVATATKFFQLCLDYFGMYVPFWAFAFVTLLGLIFVVFFVPETKGKTLEDIQEILKTGKELEK